MNILKHFEAAKVELSRASDKVAGADSLSFHQDYYASKLDGIMRDLKHLKGQIKHKAKELGKEKVG